MRSLVSRHGFYKHTDVLKTALTRFFRSNLFPSQRCTLPTHSIWGALLAMHVSPYSQPQIYALAFPPWPCYGGTDTVNAPGLQHKCIDCIIRAARNEGEATVLAPEQRAKQLAQRIPVLLLGLRIQSRHRMFIPRIGTFEAMHKMLQRRV